MAAANAQRHPADVYMEGEQPIDHYTYPKSHIRPPIAPCQNPANTIPQTNAKCHEKDAVNVPRQVDIRDDQVNDYHEYPQSHVRPPRVLGPKPTNMSPLPNNSKYPGEAYTYVQGRHVDIHGEIKSHNDHYGPLITVSGPPRPLVQTQPTGPCIAMFINTQETFILMPKDTKLILMERLSHVAITLTPLTPMLGLQCPPTQTQLTC